MTINTNKTKMLVFNKGGRLKNINIKYNNSSIECVQTYTYLGVGFNASGSFTTSKHEIHKKGNKALSKIRKTFLDDAPKVTTLLHIFNHTIRLILLYSSEILGYFSSNKYINNLDRLIKKEIRVITKLPNSEQSYKGKVKTHNYINRQNQSTTGKL